MKSIFIALLAEIESRWTDSKVDIFTSTQQEVYFITPNGYVNRFIQLSATPEHIDIIAKVIDLNNSNNRLMEHMMISFNDKGKVIFERGQGVSFDYTEASHVVDQIDLVFRQLGAVFPSK
jgi:hypothetical protein